MNDACPNCGHVLCVELSCPCNCDAARAERDLAATRETLRAVEAERDRLRTALEAVQERLPLATEDADVEAITRLVDAALAAREATGGE